MSSSCRSTNPNRTPTNDNHTRNTETECNARNGADNFLRKVRSLDCVRLRTSSQANLASHQSVAVSRTTTEATAPPHSPPPSTSGPPPTLSERRIELVLRGAMFGNSMASRFSSRAAVAGGGQHGLVSLCSTRPDDGADDSSSSSSAAATGTSLCCSSPLHDRDADGRIEADGTCRPSSPPTCGSRKLDGTPPSSPLTRTHVRSRSSSGAAVSPLVSPAVGPVDGVVAAAGRNGGEVGPTQQYSVGYVSMSILLLISCANLVFNFAPGVSRSDVRSSSSTVDPSKVSSTSALSGRKLAPAAIHSLTEALGPILPFVGGNDLRRDDASVWDLVWPSDGTDRWDELDWSWWSPLPWSKVGMGDSGDDFQGQHAKPSSGSGADAATRVGRGGAQRDPSNKKGSQKRRKSRSGVNHPKRDAAISASEPFLSPDEIGKLTLSDVTDVFHYAIHANRPGFDRDAFLKGLSPETRRAVEAMDDAVHRSRGPGVQPALTHRSSSFTSEEGEDDDDEGSSRSRFGDIDALQFCAAMRIFAEWRVVRQVPEGYKAYSVGMGLGHKDVVQNLVKVEAAIHDRQDLRREALALRSSGEPDEQEEGSEENKDQDEDDDGVLRSPTLRQLLEGEIDLGLHAKLPRLKERSAAMGLLWVRRQLHYQSRIFSNVRSAAADGDDGRKQFPTTKDAVEAAYREVYDSYHGWAVQKIFNYSFQAAPPAGEIFKFMNPAYLREVMERARTIRRDVEDEEVLLDQDGGDGYASSSVETSVRQLSPMSNEDGGTGEILDERREMFIMGGNSAAWGGAAGSGAMMTVTFTANTVSETLTVVDDMTEGWSGGEKKSNGSNPWERLGNHIGSEWDRLTNHVGSEWDRAARHVGSEWDKLANHVGSEWDRAARNVLRFLKIDRRDGGGRSKGGGNAGGPSSAGGERERGLRGEELDRYVMEEMMRSARREFGTHLEVAEPLLDDLAGLFAELNMDDPTKV